MPQLRFFLFLALLPLSLWAVYGDDYTLGKFLATIGKTSLFDLPRNQHRSVLIFGVEKKIIDEISKRFPLMELYALDFKEKESWQAIIEELNWKDRFDCVVAAHALEQASNREHMLRLIHDTLKPGKKGVLLLTIDDPYSMDYKIAKFLRESEWGRIIDVVPQLSFNDSRKLIEQEGFSIVEEEKYTDTYLVRYVENSEFQADMQDWIGDRWNIPICLRRLFMEDFLKTFPDESRRMWLYFSFNPWVLIIEKK